MIETITKLSKGDQSVAAGFKKAKQFWEKFFEVHRNDSVKDLARALGNEQSAFENLLDWSRAFAKEVMPITCLASLYDERAGFEDNRSIAVKVVKAFQQSMVSIEVKGGYLRDAVVIFNLEDEFDLNHF
jgi:hypothetical protein